MGVSDFFEDIDINKKKSKFVIKWIISISIFLISSAFIAGQIWINRNSKLDNIQSKVNTIEIKVNDVNTKVDSGFKSIDKKLNKGYTDGLSIMQQYQNHVQSQLELLIDYGNGNKELLKSALKLRNSDNERIINQTVEATLQNYNQTNSINTNINTNQKRDLSITANQIDENGNVIEEDNNNLINTNNLISLKDLTLYQVDSISKTHKILFIQLLNNGKYSIKFSKLN